MKADFVVGQRVHMTPDAIKQGLAPRRHPVTAHGKVLGVDEVGSVKVLRDGRKTPSWYWGGFWNSCSNPRDCDRADAAAKA